MQLHVFVSFKGNNSFQLLKMFVLTKCVEDMSGPITVNIICNKQSR
jgi:hypothetical protein